MEETSGGIKKKLRTMMPYFTNAWMHSPGLRVGERLSRLKTVVDASQCSHSVSDGGQRLARPEPARAVDRAILVAWVGLPAAASRPAPARYRGHPDLNSTPGRGGGRAGVRRCCSECRGPRSPSRERSSGGSRRAGWSCWAVARGDVDDDADRIAEKVAHLRAFEDEQGKMNRSVVEIGGAVLVVSQFTLLGDCRGGRRPASPRPPSPPRPSGSTAASSSSWTRRPARRHRCLPRA